jgi:hypothetical protein
LLGGMEDSIGGFRGLAGACARDLAVGFRAAVAKELPCVADFLNVVEIEFGDKEFVFVSAGLGDDFSAWIAEITFAVELAYFPRSFGADAIDGGDEILVGDGMGGLFEFPEIFGEAGDGGRRVVDNFGAIEAEDARAFREVAVVADIDAHTGVARLEDGIAGVAGHEIKLFPKAGVAMRDVVLAVFAEISAVGIDYGGGVEVDARHFDFIDGNDEDHLMFLCKLLHVRDGGAVGDGLGEFVPAGLLLGAKIGAVEKLLQAEDLDFFLGGGGDEVVMLGHHFLFDLSEGIFFGRPFTAGLDKAAADNTGHEYLPTSFTQEMLAKVYLANGNLTRIRRLVERFYGPPDQYSRASRGTACYAIRRKRREVD